MASTPTRQVYKFGTSGYRDNTDIGFSEAVVTQIAHAMTDYLIGEMEKSGKAKPLLIGGDVREKTRRFMPIVARLVQERGVDVFMAEEPLPSPVLAYAAKFFTELGVSERYNETAGAILMTASHNPWDYGGFNYLTPDAAVVPTHISRQFEAYQQNPANKTLDRKAFGLNDEATIRKIDPYAIYKKHLKDGMKIDFAKIAQSGLKVFYDPLYAVGGTYFPRMLQEEGIPEVTIHADQRPADYTGYPEPSRKNLKELAELVAQDGSTLKVGFSNDGDADRFGVLDENGAFVKADDVLALVLYHLINNRKQSGVVLRSQATSHILDRLAAKAGLQVVQTPVGYKYTAEEFIEREEKGETPVLIGGESSAGLSVLGHIPEKDGILANLLVAELIATENLPLSRILDKVKNSVDSHYTNTELGVTTDTNEQKDEVLHHFQQRVTQGGTIAEWTIDTAKSTESVRNLEGRYGVKDGAKLFLDDESWILIRASGTEPLVRVYVETTGQTPEESRRKNDALLAWVQEQLVSRFGVPSGNIRLKD